MEDWLKNFLPPWAKPRFPASTPHVTVHLATSAMAKIHVLVIFMKGSLQSILFLLGCFLVAFDGPHVNYNYYYTIWMPLVTGFFCLYYYYYYYK
jgi:hypothetical protein